MAPGVAVVVGFVPAPGVAVAVVVWAPPCGCIAGAVVVPCEFDDVPVAGAAVVVPLAVPVEVEVMPDGELMSE